MPAKPPTPPASSDSKAYTDKKAFFKRVLTLYGRKPVLEALRDTRLQHYRLHISERNRPAAILKEITALAESRHIKIQHHSAAELSRISKNAKQDQGVALDVHCPHFQDLATFLSQPSRGNRVLALDGVTNPQNLGMIIRSVAASHTAGLLIPRKGCAALGPLVIKASAGTLFSAPIVQVDNLPQALREAKQKGYLIATMEGDATESALTYSTSTPTIFVLGNESEGVSNDIHQMADRTLSIPMQRGVESLNVAVAASLIAFSGMVDRQ